jgi:zona occludens toxin (predicted ATPase)
MAYKKRYKTKFEKIFKTQIHPFRCHLMLVVTANPEKTAERLSTEDLTQRCGYVITSEGDCVMVLNQEYISEGLIAHESAHVVFAMLEQAKQDATAGEETFCYMLQDVVDFVSKSCKECLEG